MLNMSIYIIRSKDLSLHDCYIGSCKDIYNRRKVHKYNCYNENTRSYNFKLYQFIRANGGWSNFTMEELCKCDVERLSQVEQYYIDKFNPSLNSQRAYNSDEYTKEYKKDYNKEYWIKNKDVILEKQKEYQINNRDRILERKKDYYENNKDIILEKLREKFTCECGGRYVRGNKARHLRTIKHHDYINNNQECPSHDRNQLEN